MTTTQARSLATWIAATGKNLTTVYVTHGHGDHHFGLGVILDRFPGARAVATPAVVERMRESVDPDVVASFWTQLLPGQIPERLVVAEPLEDGGFDLEELKGPAYAGSLLSLDTDCDCPGLTSGVIRFQVGR